MAPFILSLVFVIILVVAPIHVATSPDSVIHKLIARQSVSPPPGCDDACNALLAATDSPACGNDIECLCGSTVVAEAQTCAQCDALVVGPAAAESLYQDYADACKEAGITIPSFNPSVPGGSSGGKASTSSVIIPSPTLLPPSPTPPSPGPIPPGPTPATPSPSISGGSSGGNTGTAGTNKGASTYSNMQISVAGAVGSAALVFMIIS